MADMMIPFIMLLILTIALILERKHHEDKICDIYEDKFKQWKKFNKDEKTQSCKKLVGLVFLEDKKLNIELLDEKIRDRLERKKYTLKG